MRAPLISVALALALGGCSLVFDSGRHTEGGSMDAGPMADAGGDPVDAGAERLPVTEFCQRYVDIVCDGVRDCCSRVPDPSEDWDQTTCRRTASDQCGATIGLVLARDYLEWDEEAAYRALTEGQAFIDDSCNPNVQDWYIDLDGFFSPIRGTRAAGEECTPSDTRSTTEILASVLSCEDGLRCIRGTGRWSCISPSELGDPCSFAFDCADTGARCTGGLFSKTCQIPGEAEGASCLLADQCESLICRSARCQPVTRDAVYCLEGAGLPDAP